MAVTVYKQNDAQQVDDLAAFSKQFEVIQAAGGAVRNDNGDMLLIFRKGKWDLPKGKLEDNEPIELCADREVKEETGLTELALRKPLLITYHVYEERGKSVLKETHWFLFDAPGKQPLKPQTNEDIQEAKWVSKADIEPFKQNTYGLILDVLAAAGF